MLIFFLIISITNLAIGYIVAVKFHAVMFPEPVRERELVRATGELVGNASTYSVDASQIPIVNQQTPYPATPPEPPSPPPALAEEENANAELEISLDSISALEETSPSAAELPEEPNDRDTQAILEAVSVDEFMRGITDFRSQLSALDQRIRKCAKSPDSRQIEGCVQEFRQANTRYLEQTSEIRELLDQPEPSAAGSSNNAREAIQQAIAIQVQEVQLSEVKLNQLNIEEDPEGSCESLLNTANALASSNDKLRDEITLAKRDLYPELKSGQEESMPALDELTQISNRQMFDLELQRHIDENEEFCVAIADVNHCGQLNLSYGPAVTDEVLKAIAKIIAASAREECRAARYSGQQFALLIPAAELEDASLVVEKIRQIVSLTEFKHEETRLNVSVSMTLIARNAGDSRQQFEQQLSAGVAKAKRKGSNKSHQVQAGEVELIPPPELELQANSYEV